MSTDRVIQRSFWRAHRQDAKGDIDESLLTKDLLDWYVDSSNEEDTVDEHDSDIETAQVSTLGERSYLLIFLFLKYS